MTRVSTPVRSTALSNVGYDDASHEMTVTFRNGRSYTHEGVPQDVYDALVAAASPGSYYASMVKGKY